MATFGGTESGDKTTRLEENEAEAENELEMWTGNAKLEKCTAEYACPISNGKLSKPDEAGRAQDRVVLTCNSGQ